MNILQQIDQMMATMRDISPLLWDYKVQLKKQGFTENQAYTLVRDFQNNLFKGENK